MSPSRELSGRNPARGRIRQAVAGRKAHDRGINCGGGRAIVARREPPRTKLRSFTAFLFAIAQVAGFSRADTTDHRNHGSIIARIQKLASESVCVVVEMPATVRPASRATIASRLQGTIATQQAVLGQSVATGDVLVTLAVPEIEARVRQAHAGLAEATRSVTRQRALVAGGANAPDMLRDAEDRFKFAQAAVAEVEAQLSYATIRAPFAGVVTETKTLPGDLAAPGMPLLVLESTKQLRAEGSVPERFAAGLPVGAALKVVLDGSSSRLRGVVDEISAAADPVTRSVSIKVMLPSGAAHSGQFARLQVVAGQDPALFIPETALSRFGQMERVWVVTDDRLTFRLVKTGRHQPGRIEVISGLSPGEVIVCAPTPALREGQFVIAQP